jgi:molybdopterin synthase catalytic subunit/molybdopterin converting factor small subunit
MVTIKLFAAAAQAVGARQLTGDWAGKTVAQVLDELKCQYPGLAALGDALAPAINLEYAELNQVLADGDELAFIPPVSGGQEPDLFEITPDPLSADAIAAKVVAPETGAAVVFVGTVREWTKGKRTVRLEYEAYPEMARRELERIGREISERWPGARTAISHRTGVLGIGEASVVIAVATPHRADAFDACRHAIERIKQIVPIWKKEIWEDGEEWIGHQSGPDWMHPGLAEARKRAEH